MSYLSLIDNEHDTEGNCTEENNSLMGKDKRQRSLTEKGVSYHSEVLLQKFMRAKNNWKKTLTYVGACMDLDEESLRTNKGLLQTKMKELNSVYAQLSTFFEDNGLDQDDIVGDMKDCLHAHSDVLKGLNDNIMQYGCETASVASRRSHFSRASSKRSSQCSAASSQSKKAELAAKAKVKLEYLELESQRENELKRVKLLKELNSSKAEMNAIREIEESDDFERNFDVGKLRSVQAPTASDFDNSRHSNIHKNKLTSDVNNNSDLVAPKEPGLQLNPEALNFEPRSELHMTDNVTGASQVKGLFCMNDGRADPVNDSLSRLADILSFRKERDSLPVPKPDVFKGDLLEYSSWVTSFESLIERKTKDPAERLYYLGLYTDGTAKKAIKGLLQIKTEESFNRAKGILTKRFGNPFLIGEAYLKQIRNWPKISPNDGPSLRDFSDFLEHCRTAMSNIQYLDILNSAAENKTMYLKLPTYLVHKWSEIVEDWVSGKASVSFVYPPFSEFCKFLRKYARIACNTVRTSLTNETQTKGVVGKERKQNVNRSKDSSTRSFATKSEETEPQREKSKVDKRTRPYVLCEAVHDLDDCESFSKKSLSEKRSFIKGKGLCFGCLRHGHTSKDCRIKKTCKLCKKRHPTSLHDKELVNKRDEKGSSEEGEIVSSNRVSISSRVHSQILPVWVHHISNPEDKILVYALLDDQSDGCFVKETTMNKLKASGPDVQLDLSTVLGSEKISCKKVTGLVVRGYYETEEIPLPHVYSRVNIPANQTHIPKPETAQSWPHLRKIASKLMPYRSDVEIGLLIGVNCLRAIKPIEIIPGNQLDQYAKKTALGWGIIGAVQRNVYVNNDQELSVYRVMISEVSEGEDKMCYFAFQTRVKEVLDPAKVLKMFELDFSERHVEGHSLSYEDRKFMDIMKSEIHQLSDGHYEMPLPFRNEKIELPNNRVLAVSRIKHLKRKLLKDEQYHRKYTEFMSDIIEKGHAEVVPADETPPRNRQIWYIPHHGVYNLKKPDKLRVVFDCSATYQGQSLNQHLLQGPDLTNNLTGVLCRFRLERVAFICDIEGMFHQVTVNAKHRNFLRFLWWKDGNLKEEPEEYQMTVHLFGATSSPSAASFALKTTADDYEEKWGSEAANFIRDEFYVDDGLKSVSSVAEARDLIHKAKNLCKEGGFRLHKFMSNNRRFADFSSR